MRKVGETLKPIPAGLQVRWHRPSVRSEKAVFNESWEGYRVALVYDELRMGEKVCEERFGYETCVGTCNIVYPDNMDYFMSLAEAQEQMLLVAGVSNREYVNIELYVRDGVEC